jgi:hypothetical protein
MALMSSILVIASFASNARGQLPIHFYRDDEVSSKLLAARRTPGDHWAPFFDSQGEPNIQALRQALKKGHDYEVYPGDETKRLTADEREALRMDNMWLRRAITVAGAYRVAQVEAELEATFLRVEGNHGKVATACLESLQIIRGVRAGAAAVKYLPSKSDPEVRAAIYWQISLSTGDALTTLTTLLDDSDDPEDKARIIRSIGRIPTLEAADRLMAIYERWPNVETRKAALSALSTLGMFLVPEADRYDWKASETPSLPWPYAYKLRSAYNKEVENEGNLTEATCAELRDFVLRHSNDESEAIRLAVTSIAYSMGTASAHRTLVTMMQDDRSSEIRDAARKLVYDFDEMMGTVRFFSSGDSGSR